MNEELVNQIVRRVLAELGQATVAHSAGNPLPAPLAAPSPLAVSRALAVSRSVGVCCGDEPQRIRRSWLTLSMLMDRAKGAKEVHLAAHESLTPSAQEYADTQAIEVKRDSSASVSAVPNSVAGTRSAAMPAAPRLRLGALLGTFGLVVHRPDLKVQALLAGLGRSGMSLAPFDRQACPMANTLALCQGIAAGELAGGVILDKYAAGAMVMAAKLAGVRPVQGVSTAAVEAALRQFDANVLVIGHAIASQYEMRTMIDRFIAGRKPGLVRTKLLEMLERLEKDLHR